MGERGPFRAADDVVGVFTLAFEEHVGLADGVGFGIDFLAVEVGDDFFFVLACGVGFPRPPSTCRPCRKRRRRAGKSRIESGRRQAGK